MILKRIAFSRVMFSKVILEKTILGAKSAIKAALSLVHSFSRASICEVIDFEGVAWQAKVDEERREGFRRVENLARGNVTQTITVVVGRLYHVTLGKDSANGATVVCSGAIVKTLTADNVNRIGFDNGIALSATTTSLVLTITGVITELFVEDVTDCSNQNPASFIKKPWQDSALNIDGSRWINFTDNPQLVAGTIKFTLKKNIDATELLVFSSSTSFGWLFPIEQSSTSTVFSNSSGTPVYYVDNVLFSGNRGDLFNLFSDNLAHDVKITNIDLIWDDVYCGGYSITTWNNLGEISNIEFDLNGDGTNTHFYALNDGVGTELKDSVSNTYAYLNDSYLTYDYFDKLNANTANASGEITEVIGADIPAATLADTLIEPIAINLFQDSFVPITKVITLPLGWHCAHSLGAGSLDITSGTATITGLTVDAYKVSRFEVTVAGTINATVNGSLDKAQVEAGQLATSFIETLAASGTRFVDKYKSSNMAANIDVAFVAEFRLKNDGVHHQTSVIARTQDLRGSNNEIIILLASTYSVAISAAGGMIIYVDETEWIKDLSMYSVFEATQENSTQIRISIWVRGVEKLNTLKTGVLDHSNLNEIVWLNHTNFSSDVAANIKGEKVFNRGLTDNEKELYSIEGYLDEVVDEFVNKIILL